MGLILDSSVVITAQRREYSVEQLIERIADVTGDQDAALSSVGLTELVHGIYRAQTPEKRRERQLPLARLLRAYREPPAFSAYPRLGCSTVLNERELPAAHMAAPLKVHSCSQRHLRQSSPFAPALFVPL